MAPGGRLETLLKAGATNEQVLDEFYLAAFARHPTMEEMTELLAALDQQAKHRESALASMEWAIISSREFAYNH